MKWLRDWWHGELITLNAPRGWPALVERDYGVCCPICKTRYEILDTLPMGAIQATVVCSARGCGEMMEVYPHPYFGWRKPIVEYRERSYA